VAPNGSGETSAERGDSTTVVTVPSRCGSASTTFTPGDTGISRSSGDRNRWDSAASRFTPAVTPGPRPTRSSAIAVPSGAHVVISVGNSAPAKSLAEYCASNSTRDRAADDGSTPEA
jgi:hypothetical protein